MITRGDLPNQRATIPIRNVHRGGRSRPRHRLLAGRTAVVFRLYALQRYPSDNPLRSICNTLAAYRYLGDHGCNAIVRAQTHHVLQWPNISDYETYPPPIGGNSAVMHRSNNHAKNRVDCMAIARRPIISISRATLRLSQRFVVNEP